MPTPPERTLIDLASACGMPAAPHSSLRDNA